MEWVHQSSQFIMREDFCCRSQILDQKYYEGDAVYCPDGLDRTDESGDGLLFYFNTVSGFSGKNKKAVEHPNLTSGSSTEASGEMNLRRRR